jgi:hypothetical protein
VFCSGMAGIDPTTGAVGSGARSTTEGSPGLHRSDRGAPEPLGIAETDSGDV